MVLTIVIILMVDDDGDDAFRYDYQPYGVHDDYDELY